MQKIMFEQERLGLEQAVLDLLKTMTRRMVNLPKDLTPSDIFNPKMSVDKKGKVFFHFDRIDGKELKVYPIYQLGEEVAIAQRYKDVPLKVLMRQRLDGNADRWPFEELIKQSKGYNNKMYVSAKLMPHRIKITDIKCERLQDISDKDCLKEGIIPFTWRQWLKQDINDFSPQKHKDWNVYILPKFREGLENAWADSDKDEFIAETPKVAFYVIIRKLMGQKTWNNNPWVWVYEFKIVK